ncbi:MULTISPECIES: hypothetical protein [Klebsiella]|uniref:hypothetical protein n=1 Tax=Klebsiella TaxID=570 RepID=UPI00287D04CD|nr:hypothetical protein [Klebsiella michiganensis]MDS7764316.1 hypothetical protein [Klebsiella michiganensis]HBW1146262.1 hypothetical protein [Klebsiella pneumoniae]
MKIVGKTMTKSTITRERLEKIKSWRETYGAGSNVMLPAEEAEALALIALAAMDSEPVALKPELAKVIYHFRDWNEGFPVERFKADYVISWMLANYPPAQPAPLVPDGYVMVPKEPTEAMMLHNSGCQHHTWDDPDCAMRQTRRLIWSHMLAAAPQEVKGE